MTDRPPAHGARAKSARPKAAADPSAAPAADPRQQPPAVVVGVDGSECSMRAAAYAAGLARRQGGVLVAVYARKSPSGFAYLANTPGALAAVVEAETTTELRIRAEIAEECDAAGIDGTLVVRSGSLTHAVCAMAHERHVVAVIIGSRPGLLGRMLPAGRRRLLARVARTGRPVVLVP